MIIWKHILKRARKVIQYLMLLVISSFLVIVGFGLIYRIAGIENPLAASVNVFFDINAEHNKPVYYAVVQQTIKEIFIVFFLGSIISQFIEKPNPIYFSKYVSYIKAENRLRLRFWILLPLNQYLYNVNIKIMVLDDEGIHRAENEIKSVLDVHPVHENYSRIRGVWEVDVTDKSPGKPDEIIAFLKKYKGFKFKIILNGTNENGRIFCGIKNYEYKDFLENVDFVSIRSTEFLNIKGAEDDKIPQKKIKKFFRYQNFNKVYLPADKDLGYKKTINFRKIHIDAQADILTSEQIKVNQYCGKGLKAKADDFFSHIFHFIYNNED